MSLKPEDKIGMALCEEIDINAKIIGSQFTAIIEAMNPKINETHSTTINRFLAIEYAAKECANLVRKIAKHIECSCCSEPTGENE